MSARRAAQRRCTCTIRPSGMRRRLQAPAHFCNIAKGPPQRAGAESWTLSSRAVRGRYADALLSDGAAVPAERSRPAVNEYFQPEWNGGTTLLGPDRSVLVRGAGSSGIILVRLCSLD